MMQQQLYQQQEQQTGAQDASGHQMVLCPVRVVYETQMLVQPGEQIQPNQTIFINPQNPPPWIQNRAVQNQVIYVQHMPTNYVQQTQQHIDPSQLYIQNYGYQNVPQMLVQNPQEQIRPMQITQPNVISNTQVGIGQNVQTQRLVQNITTLPNTLNLVNTQQNQNNSINRQIAQNQIANINEMVTNIKQETVGQNVYRQVPQTLQQDPRNQIQQTVTLVPNNIQRPVNVFDQNIGQMQPIQQQNIANIQNTYQNAMINVQDARKLPAPVNKNITYNVVQPNISVKGPQTFRPIQPRTSQLRPNAPHFHPVQPNTNLVQSGVPNMVNRNVPRKMIPNTVQVPNSIAISSTGKIENNVIFNRKRKSESPDEMHKKVSIGTNSENPIIIKKIENIPNTVNCSDIGVNTSPIHRSDGRITINTMQITPLNTSSTQNVKIKEELAKKPITIPINEPQNVIRNNIVPSSIPSVVTTEKEKLVRNTVFTQARGRVLNDKQTVEISKPEVSALSAILNSPVATVSTEVTPKQEISITKETKESPKVESKVPEPIKVKPNIPNVVENKATSEEDNKVKNDNCDKKAMDDIKLKEDRDFILTHVLDGYVIQESNIAFPIRKPLKEKTIPNNADETDLKELTNLKTDKDSGVKNNSKILNISHLHIKDIETAKNCDKVNDKENPFRTLQPSIVKSWTAEQLETHLTKFGWNETVAVLQEHEIDGESLLLVSKGQLLTIGVKDEHADVISDFVKS